jgi:putative ABC transport system permease protein
MLKWAIKTLLSQPGSLVGSALGIACAFFLVIFFDAVWRGESVQIVAYPNNIKPDVWVMQSGVGNMHMAMSFVWDWKADKIASMTEVKQVTPISYINTVIRAGEYETFVFIVGLLPEAHRAGPWAMSDGRGLQNPREAVIPDVLSRLTGVGIGETLKITDKSFTVVGLSKGTYSSANPVLFIPFDDLEDILSSSGTYSFLLVDAHEGSDAGLLAKKIRHEVEKVNALTHDEFIANDLAMARQMGVEIIVMMTFICGALAVLIVGFTAYSLTMRKKQELAIIKALGIQGRSIFFAVMWQSTLVTALGFGLASVLAYVLIPVIPTLVPQLTVMTDTLALVQFGMIALLVALAGAIIPAYLVLRVDPATAFQV